MNASDARFTAGRIVGDVDEFPAGKRLRVMIREFREDPGIHQQFEILLGGLISDGIFDGDRRDRRDRFSEQVVDLLVANADR